MPLYEYQCTKCHRRAERIESVRGPHLKTCPACGARVERLQSAPAIQFKGGGWYVTDYAGKKSSTEEVASTDKGEKKESSKVPVAKESKEKKKGST